MDRVSKCVTAKAIQLFKIAIFALLFIVAFFFAELIIEQYLEGSTYFSTTQTQVSKEDLPTVTICFLGNKDFVYGSDFEIQTLANKSSQTDMLLRSIHIHSLSKSTTSHVT